MTKKRVKPSGDWRERHVYFYTCSGPCGKKKRQSFKRGVARAKYCRLCRRLKPHPDQRSLFPAPPEAQEGPREGDTGPPGPSGV